jgi:hypothetical protein
MTGSLANKRIWFAAGFTDVRRSFDGLAVDGADSAGEESIL